MLFSTGTTGSSDVWNRNAGGVRALTWRSFDSSSTSFGSGVSPSRLCREPVWVNGALKEMTG